MPTMTSFFEPLVIRWINRNTCFCCGAPATRKCRTHRTRICESSHCKMTHRRLKASVYGDLTRPLCDYTPMATWKKAVLGCAVSLAAGFALMGFILVLL